MTLYMAVTSDELELPIAVETSLAYLASKLNLNPNNISSSIRKNASGKRTGAKFYRVEVDE